MEHVLEIELVTDTNPFEVLLTSVASRMDYAWFLQSSEARESVVLSIVQDVATYVLAWEGNGQPVVMSLVTPGDAATLAYGGRWHS